MSRSVFAFLALAICFTLTSAYGPKNLAEAITRSWTAEHTRTARDDWGIPPAVNYSFVTQRLDNFDLQNNATFQQRYLAYDRYFRPNGPIYVILGSHRAISEYDIQFSLIASLARSEGGIVYLLENRFYGASIPTADLTLESLKYLTVEQTLADAAHFITHIKQITPYARWSQVVVTGREYGGSLAIWLRQKYPHLTNGAWASSGKLLALHNHQQYKVNAAANIRRIAGDSCYQVIESGFQELQTYAEAGNLSGLSELLNVCDETPLQNANDVSTLFLLISEVFSDISTFRAVVTDVCNVLLNETHSSPGAALASTFTELNWSCVPVDYEGFIRFDSQTELDGASYFGLRQATYQFCTQLGWFSTSESPFQPFGSYYPLSFFTEICTRVFGEETVGHVAAQANQDRFNTEHGGLNPWVSNALFTHGEFDNTQSLNVLRDLHFTAVVREVPDGGVSYDFSQISSYDEQSLIDLKLDIMSIIRSWTYRR